MGSQASAPSSPHCQLYPKLMSTTVLFNFKAVAKAWPWNAFRVQSWIILMQGILRKLEFKKTDLKVFGIRWSRQTSFWCSNPAEQNGYDYSSNALKCVQTSSATSTHVRCFWDGLKKPLQNHHVVPWCLRHRSGILPDSDALWCDWSSTSPPVPSRMQLCKAALRFHRRLTPQHLHTLDPSPPHLGPLIAAVII